MDQGFRPAFDPLAHLRVTAQEWLEAVRCVRDFGMPIVAVYDAASQGLLGGFSAYPGQTAGVRVATVDRDGDGRADILTSFNAPIPIVAVYGGLSFSLMDGFFAQTPGIADSPNGIYVG